MKKIGRENYVILFKVYCLNSWNCGIMGERVNSVRMYSNWR